VELTELIKDYVATELLSSIEIDFLEGELWETTQHIAEINTVIKAPKNICEKLDIDEKSCWHLCCAAVFPVFYGFFKKKIIESDLILSIVIGLVLGLLFFPNTSFTNSLLVGGLINNEFFPVIIKNYLLFWSFLIATIAPAVTVLFKYNPSK